jgi:hypothetical protein
MLSCCHLLEKQAPFFSSAHKGILLAICWENSLNGVLRFTMDLLLQIVGKAELRCVLLLLTTDSLLQFVGKQGLHLSSSHNSG